MIGAFEDARCSCYVSRIFIMKGSGTYTKIGTIQRRLAWPLRKDDTQIREAFHIFHSYVSVINIGTLTEEISQSQGLAEKIN